MSARRRPLVLCVVVLILAATVLPVTAIEPAADSRSTLSRPAPLKAGSSPAEFDAFPLERKRAAIAVIESMDVGWRFQARQRDRAIDRLNDTLSAYRDGYRVSRPSVFRSDRRALRALATIAWTNETAAEQAADLVVAADLETANTSIEDAEFAPSRVGHRIDDPRELRRAERAIDRAVRARDRGLRILGGDHWHSWRTTSRRRALVHLGVAWFHAQYALDVLDRASQPALSIETRSDPPRDGSDPVVRTIRGNVSDVRAYEFGNVTVSVNGTVVGSAPLDALAAPGRNASFAVNVTLDAPVARVSITVGDHEAHGRSWREGRRPEWRDRFDHLGGRSRGRDSTFDSFDRRRPDDGRGGVQAATATVRFDGDGLPDTYETVVAATDPLDPDSDSLATDGNEADDGVLDGGEDFDRDGLITYAEHELGTDPFANDTDTDGLSDRFEASLPVLVDPTEADTDGDGILDGAEDFDGDGLLASDESANGTSVARADSDGDGLDDGEEVRIHETSPIDGDSDDDGLGDAEELRLAVDPLVADTDGDGVPDGNETFTTTATDDETGVSISTTGRGDVASLVDVENISQPTNSDYLAAPVVRLKNHTDFDHARVTLRLHSNVTSTPGNLSVYKWSPSDDRPWHPLNSTMDVGNGTASANVSSFSYFTVMDGPEWKAAITDTVSLDWPRFDGFDDLTGWDVTGDARVEAGKLVVSGPDGDSGPPTIVVATDGSGDYERIQPAVDAAVSGQTVLIMDGTYSGQIVVDESIRLVGQGGVLDGRGTGGVDSVGVTIQGENRVTIQDLEISGFSVGVSGASSAADVTILRTAIQGGRIGIDGRETEGDWTLSNVSVAGSDLGGLRGDASTGDWSLRNVVLNGSGWHGLTAFDAVGDWRLSRVEMSSNEGNGIAVSVGGYWSISDSIVASNGRAGVISASHGRITLTRSRIEDNGKGGVDGEDSLATIVAVSNWWGRAAGPSPGQIDGDVEWSPHCSNADCAPESIEAAPPGSGPGGTEAGDRPPAGGSGSGPTSIERTASLPPDVSSIEATVRLRGTGPATLRVSDGQRTLTLADLSNPRASFASVSGDLSRFAGETVTVELVAEDGAEVVLDWIDLGIDTDGDGLRDAVENAALGMPSGPMPGVSLAALDPSNPDSDGDGLPDGEELTGVALHPRSGGTVTFGSLRALSADSDPTRENSDGGGLTDGEEVQAGSDPFVLETLVIGYTIPTMTHGPEDTLEDRQPMTVGEANGLEVGGGRESNVIAWPSRQYSGRLFCIKELTAGPGCSEAWMQGVDFQDDKFYLYVPFVVYAQSDVEFGEVEYRLTPNTHAVKEVNTAGTIGSGETRRGYIVYEFLEQETGNDFYRNIFRPIGELTLDVDLSSTVFHRPEPSTVGRQYTVSTSTTLPRTEQMLEDTQTVLEQGINVAFAAEAGYLIAIETGSSLRGALAFLYHLARSQQSTPPTSVEDVAEKISYKGIAAFEEKVRETQGAIDEEIFDDGTVRAVGPTIVRQI